MLSTPHRTQSHQPLGAIAKLNIKMTSAEFFKSYKSGQRYFHGLDFEYEEGFNNNNFSDVIFDHCFLYLDFRSSTMTNAQFLNCNIKEIDLRNSDLTGALMRNCLVESAMFKGAIVENFRFIDNYYFGATIGQKDFDEVFINNDESI